MDVEEQKALPYGSSSDSTECFTRVGVAVFWFPVGKNDKLDIRF